MPVDKKGYLIPSPIDPGGERCISVWIPDDDQALYDFMGAYDFFTHWIAHAKEGGTTARDRAIVWQRAYQRTNDEPLLCIPMADIQDLIDAIVSCCEAIQDKLDTSNDIQNNLVNNIDLIVQQGEYDFIINCTPCEDRPPYFEPPNGPVVDPVNNPPVGSTPDEYYNYLCLAANYIVFYTTSTVIGNMYQQLSAGSRVTIYTLLSMLTTGGFVPSWDNLTAVYNLIREWFDAAELVGVAIELNTMANELVCAFYTATGPQNYLTQRAAVYTLYSASQEAQDYFNNMVDMNVINKVYAGEIEVPEGFLPSVNCESECNSLLVGSWYPVDEILGEQTEYVFTSQSLDNWRVVGHFYRGSITNLQFRSYNDYAYGAGVVSAVSFTVDECTLAASPNNCQFWQFGNPNAPVLLGPGGPVTAGVAPGESVLIYIAGDTPPAGSFDHTLTVNYANDLIGLFIFGQFTYAPPDRVVTFEITDFTVYTP